MRTFLWIKIHTKPLVNPTYPSLEAYNLPISGRRGSEPAFDRTPSGMINFTHQIQGLIASFLESVKGTKNHLFACLTACVMYKKWDGVCHHTIRVGAVDGEVVDRGCGGVATEVDNPNLVAGGGAELVAGVEVGGVIPARCFAPQAMHGGLKEAAVVVDPERMLRGRDERL
jgi:hypothetical protein